jgi:hypothetical protein
MHSLPLLWTQDREQVTFRSFPEIAGGTGRKINPGSPLQSIRLDAGATEILRANDGVLIRCEIIHIRRRVSVMWAECLALGSLH